MNSSMSLRITYIYLILATIYITTTVLIFSYIYEAGLNRITNDYRNI